MSISFFAATLGTFAIYVLSVALYRLFLHPLSHVPGPKLAAISLWYEFYYDVIKQGRYVFEIMRMHDKYGPLVRISPNELHCSDPAFIPILYSGARSKRDKYWYMAKQFGNSESVFGTVPHELHRVRRAPLNPFFSKASVIKLESLVQAKVLKLCDRLEQYSSSGADINMTMAYGCMTSDIIAQYAFTRTYDFLDSPAFGTNFHRAIVGATKLGPLFKQFPILLPALQSLPDRCVAAISRDFALQIKFRQDMKAQIAEAKTKKVQSDGREQGTIFEHLLATPLLPDREKTVERLWQDASTVIGAGTETTAQMITESLRMSYGISTRLQRIAPHALQYEPSELLECPADTRKAYTIPPGTPVGMSSVQIHHNEKVFDQSWEFRPERWLSTPAQNPAYLHQYLLSFSKGTRQCIGINLAYAELYYTTAAIIRRFGLRMVLRDTNYEDHIRCEHDYFVPVPKDESGVRVQILSQQKVL